MSEVPGAETMKKLGEPFPEFEEDVAENSSSGWIIYAARLDEVVGFGFWRSDFDAMTNGEIRCTISLKTHNNARRVGIGSNKNQAFIHACEQLGIGQYLHMKKHMEGS